MIIEETGRGSAFCLFFGWEMRFMGIKDGSGGLHRGGKEDVEKCDLTQAQNFVSGIFSWCENEVCRNKNALRGLQRGKMGRVVHLCALFFQKYNEFYLSCENEF